LSSAESDRSFLGIADHKKLLESTRVEDFQMRNRNNLKGHAFAQTYKSLMAVLEIDEQRIEARKRRQNAASVPHSKRRPNDFNPRTARPSSSGSGSTRLSGTSAESKDEDYSRALLNDFIDDVMDVLGWEGTELQWPASPYYIALRKRYYSVLQV
jgi:hypothetical protein